MTTREYYLRNREKVLASNQAYKNANREKLRIQSVQYMREMRSTDAGRKKSRDVTSKYRKDHPEKVKASVKAWFDAHPHYNREYIMKRAKADPRLYLFRQAKRRAALKGIEFSISIDEIIVPDICPVLGVPIVVGSGNRGRANYSPSVDRFDNSKGYVSGNVRVISMRANWLKSDATVDELRKVLAYLENG